MGMAQTNLPSSRGNLRVLFVEDSEDDTALLVRHLGRAGYEVDAFRVDTRDGFKNAIENARWDLVISDHSMPHFSSLEALRLLHEHDSDCPFIIVSGTIGEDMAVDAMRAGAHDYVLKSNLARLAPAIERELGDAEDRRAAREEREARQAVERQLQQSQKMEAVGRLAGGVAHDFNNLLTAILGFTGLALEKLEGGTTEVKFELEQVKLASERAARFTKQLLAFSRQQVMTPRRIDPVDSIDAMLPLLRQLMNEDVSVTATGQLHAGMIKVDPGQFEQVIMNLAVNARDAMPKGGTLQIETDRIDLEFSDATRMQIPPGQYMRISVSDNGLGMDDLTRGRIFEPFFTTKPPGKGTGLGLSTVYGILKQSGGAISVDSTVGAGTMFRVYLPVEASTGGETETPASESRRLVKGEGVILVAEDEHAVRVLVRTVLTNAGYQVFEAESGAQAAAMLQEMTTPIDLLVTDVVMSGMVGPDLAGIAVARFPDVRVLYITGYATHSAIPTGFLNEGDGVLAKPFLPEQLLSKVHERLGIIP
jgi:two-component system cell cycle sensor histidine kinase/response regulator CckA